MKKLVLVLLVMSANVMAVNLTQYNGVWRNVDANTGSFTRLQIRTLSTDDIRVRAFGACSPRDCDMGLEQAVAYGVNVNSNLMQNTKRMSVVYDTSFSKVTLLMKVVNPNVMNVIALTEFTHGSRSSYVKTLQFRKNGGANPAHRIHFSTAGTQLISKFVFLEYTYNLNSAALTTALKLSVGDQPVKIQSVTVVYRNGTRKSLDSLLGNLNAHQEKTARFRKGHVVNVIVTASSINPIGSRGELTMSAGTTN